MTYFKYILALFCIISFNSQAKMVDTNLLLTLDLDQMKSMVRSHIVKSDDLAIKSQDSGTEKEQEGNIIYELKKASLLILSRPNRDNMVRKLLPEVENKLNSYNAYYPTLKSLIKESIQIIADEEAPKKVKSAYLYIIENTLAELKPSIKKKEKKPIEIYRDIAAAKIKIPKKLSQFRILDKMEEGDFDPSGYAKKILKEYTSEKKSSSWWQFWK